MLIYLQMIDSDEDRSKFVFLYKKYKGLMFFVAHEIPQELRVILHQLTLLSAPDAAMNGRQSHIPVPIQI